MKTLSAFLAFLMATCTFAVHGQSGFKPGYVITLEGDTLRGAIDYKRWDKNPRTISFKKDGASQASDFGPIEIRRFSVANEVYVGAVVDVDISPFKVADLAGDSAPKFVKDTVFLQVLLNGDKSLFFLKDQDAKIHFYILDGEYRPLVYKQYIQSVYDPHTNGYKKGIFENAEFKTQLSRYLGACEKIATKMRLLKYETSSLLKLYQTYYECVNKAVEYSNRREETEVRMGVQVAACATRFSFTDATWSRLKEFNSPVNVAAGGFVDLRLLRTRAMTIANDLYFTSFETSAEGYVPKSGSFDRALSTFSAQIIKSNHQLRFGGAAGHGAYFSVGISLAMSFEKFETTVLKSEPVVNKTEANGLIFGPVAGVGYGLGKFSAELRAEKPSRRRDYDMLALYLFVRYRLN